MVSQVGYLLPELGHVEPSYLTILKFDHPQIFRTSCNFALVGYIKSIQNLEFQKKVFKIIQKSHENVSTDS